MTVFGGPVTLRTIANEASDAARMFC